MVIVNLIGGLGNQMFEYAAGRALSLHLNVPLKIDVRELLDRTPKENYVYRNYDLDIFDLHVQVASANEIRKFEDYPKSAFLGYLLEVKKKFFPYTSYFEKDYKFAPEFFQLPKEVYLYGYWQSPRYFDKVNDVIRKDFSFREPISVVSINLKEQILLENSVCINVRRADFVNNSFHGVCDMKYFIPAIELMVSKIGNPHFFIFSDDMEWCSAHFKLDFPVTFVGHEHAGKKFANYLQLMSLCKHYIIPNSSFAWWAVWLNGEDRKDRVVIAPETWFTDPGWDTQDLIPGGWIRLAN